MVTLYFLFDFYNKTPYKLNQYTYKYQIFIDFISKYSYYIRAIRVISRLARRADVYILYC